MGTAVAAFHRQDRTLVGLFTAGAIGLIVLPWYALDGGFWTFGWLAAYPDAATAPAVILAAAHERPWLWPLFLALLVPLPALFGERRSALPVLAGGIFG